MRAIIEDIKDKLKKSVYKNEEHIRFSLVSRILKGLEWNIWDPTEVNTEFSPSGEKGRIDIALFHNKFIQSDSPVYIEIKAAEKLNNQKELEKAEYQLRDYNVDLTALFTILTDGNQWRFYYSQEGGTFSQKCFKIVDFLRDDVDDIEYALISFLGKAEIESGKAKKEAYEYLQMNRKQRIMEESLTNAKREQDNDPLLNLVDALCNEVEKKGIKINKDEADEFLRDYYKKNSKGQEYNGVTLSPQREEREQESYSNRKNYYKLDNNQVAEEAEYTLDGSRFYLKKMKNGSIRVFDSNNEIIPLDRKVKDILRKIVNEYDLNVGLPNREKKINTQTLGKNVIRELNKRTLK